MKAKGKKVGTKWNYEEASTVQILYIDEIRFADQCSQLNLVDLGYNCNKL